jgi:hypothetical protein
MKSFLSSDRRSVPSIGGPFAQTGSGPGMRQSGREPPARRAQASRPAPAGRAMHRISVATDKRNATINNNNRLRALPGAGGSVKIAVGQREGDRLPGHTRRQHPPAARPRRGRLAPGVSVFGMLFGSDRGPWSTFEGLDFFAGSQVGPLLRAVGPSSAAAGRRPRCIRTSLGRVCGEFGPSLGSG